ncbi:MAG TPA: LPXTG cell wall anchor domain-containing protein [Flavisolibacter sp.]|nr:LPXTG cell wall anchor domain-containing protein [Flavisolibacter sp.]
MRKLLLLFIVLFFFSVGHTQVFSAAVDTSTILIGEKIKLTFKGSFPKGRSIPWIDIDTIPHFEIMAKSTVDSQQIGTDLVLTQTYTLTSWDSGRWNIPSFYFGTASSRPILISVTYTPFDVSQPYNDIKDILEVEPAGKSTWYWYLLAAILLLILLYFIFRKKKKKPVKAAPAIHPYKKAINNLEVLRESNLHRTDVKEFYSRLIRIFRDYVHEKKAILSHSKTTDDLSIQLMQLQLPKGSYSKLIQILRMSDLVKFAKYNPLQTDNENAFKVIRESITTIEDAV